jgi:hypothetical protein
MKKQWIAGMTVAGAMGMLAGCTQMQHMMGSDTGGKAGQKVALSGDNQVPPVSTPASGSGTVTVNADCTVSANISVTGMTATAAHIHQAEPGKNGPVIVPFTKSGDNAFSAPPGSKMTPEQCAAYKAGNTYVNVHSAKNPNGEVRAQLKGS